MISAKATPYKDGSGSYSSEEPKISLYIVYSISIPLIFVLKFSTDLDLTFANKKILTLSSVTSLELCARMAWVSKTLNNCHINNISFHISYCFLSLSLLS